MRGDNLCMGKYWIDLSSNWQSKEAIDLTACSDEILSTYYQILCYYFKTDYFKFFANEEIVM